jgi:hypothetical protein
LFLLKKHIFRIIVIKIIFQFLYFFKIFIFIDIDRIHFIDVGELLLKIYIILFLKISSSDDIHLTTTELNEQQNELQLFLQEEENVNVEKAKQLQTKLTNIKNNYNKALKLLQAVRSLQQQLPNIPANKKDLLWFATTEAMALEKLSKNNLIVQKKVQLEIDALQHINISIG